DIALDRELVPFLGVADIIDGDVVVLAPEEGDGGKLPAVPEHVERRSLSLALGNHPMLDANGLAAVRIGPACNVARREDPRCARFEIGVHHDAAINGKPRRFGKPGSWAHANTGDDEIGLQPVALLKLYLRAIDAA